MAEITLRAEGASVPFCPECGYLTDIISPRTGGAKFCPRCNSRVRIVKINLAWKIARPASSRDG